MENHINKLYENLAESYNKDIGKLLQAHDIAKAQLHDEGFRGLDLDVKAYHVVKSKLATQTTKTGKVINVVFMGKDESKDKSSWTMKKILEAFWSDPESRKKIIEEGNIMVGQVAKGDPNTEFHDMYKPITAMSESVEVDGMTIPVKFDLWDPSTNIDPMCRDNKSHMEYGDKVNWNHTKELKPNWKTTLFGIGYFEDTPNLIKKVQVRFFGDDGDPNSGTFVCKHISFMKEYKMKVAVNEDITTDECYVCNSKSKPVLSEEGVDLNIVEMMNGINEGWRNRLAAAEKDPKDLIPIVSLADLKKWHVERRAQKDEDGEVKKNNGGWDETNWDEYCLIDQIQYLGRKEFKNEYTPAVIGHDSIGNKNSMLVNYDEHLDMDIPIPCDILICVKTGRGTTKYDRESNEKILDSDDPDLKITICGFKMLADFEKIVFPKGLLGDI